MSRVPIAHLPRFLSTCSGLGRGRRGKPVSGPSIEQWATEVHSQTKEQEGFPTLHIFL